MSSHINNFYQYENNIFIGWDLNNNFGSENNPYVTKVHLLCISFRSFES